MEMLQANSALTPAQIYSALQKTALAMPVGGNPTPDYLSGYGFIQADAALASLPPGPPNLTLAASTITMGATAANIVIRHSCLEPTIAMARA